MRNKALTILGLALLTGCASPRVREDYKVNNLEFIFASGDEINELRYPFGQGNKHRVAGFYNKLENKVYCRWNVHDNNIPDFYVLGHEVWHALGKSHRYGTNKFPEEDYKTERQEIN